MFKEFTKQIFIASFSINLPIFLGQNPNIWETTSQNSKQIAYLNFLGAQDTDRIILYEIYEGSVNKLDCFNLKDIYRRSVNKL